MKSAARIALGFPAIPLLCGLLATAVFVLQGGFGGGHGSFDGLIFLLGLPCNLVVTELPLTGHDLADLIWIPTALNMVLFATIGCSIAGPLAITEWIGRRRRRLKASGTRTAQ
jgi:hypothetical protein